MELCQICPKSKPEAAARLLKLAEKLPAKEFDFFIVQALGRTRQPAVLPYLKKQLHTLEKMKKEWRALRDKTELMQDEEDKLKKLKNREYMEAETAYAIAQVHPLKEGLKLLKHPFYNVRVGAWLGIGHNADGDTVSHLVAEIISPEIDKKPFKRHALYRAIDTSLVTLEAKGGPEDLKTLTKLRFPPRTEILRGVAARLEWTEARMRERFE